MIEAVEVHKHFQKGPVCVKAVNGISLKIHKGEFVFIIGPSGSGKTTLLDMLGALSHPTGGRIYFEGRELRNYDDFQLSMIRRDKIGFVFQSFNLIPTLNALENVLIPLIPEGIEPEEEERAKELLTKMGLGDRFYHRPAELSGGETQRVAVARALVNNPLVVMADEPTGELDSKTGRLLIEQMRKMNKEKETTFVIVTHDTEFIEKTDTVYEIKDGLIHRIKKPTRR